MIKRMAFFRFVIITLYISSFLLPPFALHAVGDWIVYGVYWKGKSCYPRDDNLLAGIDKNGNIYINSNYGIFKYDSKKDSWIQEPANFDWRKIKRPSTSIKRQRVEGPDLYEIEVSDSIVYEYTENWFKDSLRFKKINPVTGKEFLIAVDISVLPELEKSFNNSYYNKILNFDGKRIWFTLCASDAMGAPISSTLRYLDITNDSLGFIPKSKFPSCDFYPRVSKVISDSKYIWIGTGIPSEQRGMVDNLGLFRLNYDLGNIVNYSKENNTLPSNGILNLLEYKNILWVATTKGIAKLDLKTEQWKYYNISEYITVDKDEKIEYLPGGEVVAESIKIRTIVKYLGSAYGGESRGYYIVKLKRKQEGWVKASGYVEKPREVEALNVYLAPSEKSKKVSGRSGFYAITYPVVGEEIKGWYKVIIDKGVIPGTSARFTLVKINLQE